MPVCVLTNSAACHLQDAKQRWHFDIFGCGDTLTEWLQKGNKAVCMKQLAVAADIQHCPDGSCLG